MKKDLSTSAKEYIKSDHFIHDYLARRLTILVEKLRTIANSGGEVSSVLVFWPEKRVEPTEFNAVIMDVADPTQMKELAQGGAAKTKANAVGFVLSSPDGIKVGLETHVGTEVWSIHKQKRGDIYFFKAPEKTSNEELFGLFWKQG